MPRLINRIAHYALTAAAAKGARTVTTEHLEHAVAELRNLPYLLVPHELSDEAAAQLSELLNDLAVAFDGQYFAQITRYYVERRQSERPAITGNSSSSSTTTWRSESPAAPASARPARPSAADARGGEPIFTTTTAITAASVHACALALRR